ncbi:hypothetical protein EV651_1292 [Kribbella sp. VKM Ac-2571]|uniref:hypothetical protein n=1 Tax=Kribbella sp. VKM Ac-2571 TaxID=2512222 RepID=UPI0010612CD8|nr:hypothetical protein [Kribbella sp. VKM Ac-2571]TDO45481.1 hypothetical protein EV651_1292 [Kribbella sp. VKM Ac-2571]
MSTSYLLTLLLLFCFSLAVAKNWRKVLIFLAAVLLTAAFFGLYTIGVTLQSDCDPAQPYTPRNQIAAAATN